MSLAKRQGNWVILLSFVVAFMLDVMPLPEWAVDARPAWIALVLIYWCMALPERVGIGIAWVLGLLLDVLEGTLLGQHALGLVVIAYITLQTHRRVRVFPLLQQAVLVGLLLLLYLLLALWVMGIVGRAIGQWSYWLPALTSMVLWPWIFIVLRDLRRKYNVS
ncbi:MAG: rod shape-determining protein MreD [Gammaproteobacteria bacterium]|nr:rod shape-determining protein MreD [Gammaproteobacteria bacterium]